MSPARRDAVTVVALLAAFALLLLACVGCGGTVTDVVPGPTDTVTVSQPPGEEGEQVVTVPTQAPGPEPSTGRCGLERWAVKTGTDSDAGKIKLHPAVDTTVGNLSALQPPADLPQSARVAPAEETVYRVRAVLARYKLEDDSDIHGILIVPSKHLQMIVEFPDPSCVKADSPLLPGIRAARAEFDARLHATSRWADCWLHVAVTGVGFFDEIHGQSGVATNGIELHPVLGITFAKAAA